MIYSGLMHDSSPRDPRREVPTCPHCGERRLVYPSRLGEAGVWDCIKCFWTWYEERED